MNITRLIAVAAAVAFAVRCGDRDVAGVASPQTTLRGIDEAASSQAALRGIEEFTFAAGGPRLTVLTHNVYYGADFGPLLTAAPEEVPLAAATAWAMVQHNDFPARAGAIAAEIAAERPDLVALQEAAFYRLQHPGDLAFGGTSPATQVVYDFVALILDSLKAHHLHYVVAAADSTTDVELPVLTGIDPGTGFPTFDDVRLTDRDAILARADVAFKNPQHSKYAAYIPVSFGALQLGIYEGWSSIEVPLAGRTYRFVATHLEFQQAEPVQLAQAAELLALLQHETRPTILVGDFNSDAYGRVPAAATPTYGNMLDAGFADSWLERGRHAPGLTCCQSVDLSNRQPTLDQRIDFIFTRNLPAVVHAGTLITAEHVVGDRRADRTASGLWPSDHAGVVARFLTPPVGKTHHLASKEK
jgi:endonuclease/exonuclease/phosphatase family metal-dependent hydrolase